jgi:hypothetical protein
MTDDDLLDMLKDAADGLSPGKEGWQPYRERLQRIIEERNTFRDDAIPQAAQIMNELTVTRDAALVVVRDFAERVATAAGVSLTWTEADQVGEPGTPKYNDRLIADVERALAERDRLRAVVEDAVDMLSRQDADYDEWTALLGRLTAALDAKEGT